VKLRRRDIDADGQRRPVQGIAAGPLQNPPVEFLKQLRRVEVAQHLTGPDPPAHGMVLAQQGFNAGDRAAISRNLRLIEQSQLALLDGADQAHGCLAAVGAEQFASAYISDCLREIIRIPQISWQS
jgi:hypothetical protein